MSVWWYAFLASWLFCLLSGPEAKTRHAVPTYFKRLNPDGSVVDADDPQNRIKFVRPIRQHFTPSATLKVSPSLVENGAAVNVSWSGVTQPNDTDFIAFYCPEDDQLSRLLLCLGLGELRIGIRLESGQCVQHEKQVRV